ncbi:MAG: prepilin peptidase [Candidatus Melainabacteria bacterium]|nr:prepilin peptidase [Candidatus Melainabacteria bacterium]
MDTAWQPWVYGFTFIVGLVIGSFLNVMALRLIAEESFVTPPSHCPACKTPIQPWDNIPVLSYLLLNGQCRQCKTTISIQYPLTELATGLLFVMLVAFFGVGWHTPLLMFLVANLVVITITDWRTSEIYFINSWSLVPAGLLYNFLNLGEGTTALISGTMSAFGIEWPAMFVSALIGAAGIIGLFTGLNLLSRLLVGQDGFGGGDTHLLVGVAAFLGWQGTLIAFVLGFLAQALLALPMLAYQWFQRKDYTTLTLGAGALLSAFLPLGLSALPLEGSFRPLILLGSIGVCLLMLVLFLIRLRKNPASLTYMPLGPALVLGTLISLFYGRQLLPLLPQW